MNLTSICRHRHGNPGGGRSGKGNQRFHRGHPQDPAGLRPLQKYAVVCGGGKNHRYNLSDAAMLKDNHIDAGGGITKAISSLRAKLGHMVKIEVETRNLEELEEALGGKGRHHYAGQYEP